MTKNIILFLVLFASVFSIDAQEVHGNANVWFTLNTKYKLNEKWSLNNEVHFRLDDFFNSKQQFLVRPSASFSPKKFISFAVGYTYLRTYPYGKYPLAIARPEHNFWQQVQFNHGEGNWRFVHRYRMEHRYSGQILSKSSLKIFSIDGYNFSNRFRYKVGAKYLIDDKIAVFIADEVWISMSTDFSILNYDRNWLNLGASYKASDKLSFALSYLQQNIRNNASRYEVHPTIQTTVNLKF